jgi:N-acyl-D-aspartate/D-glutamate deacylase
MQTHDTARCVGLEDRGTLEVGMKADLNLIDFEKLQLGTPHIIFDLPAGGRRMFQDAQGYVATIVSGEVIMENGTYTGAVPGKLIRGTQPAPKAA